MLWLLPVWEETARSSCKVIRNYRQLFDAYFKLKPAILNAMWYMCHCGSPKYKSCGRWGGGCSALQLLNGACMPCHKLQQNPYVPLSCVSDLLDCSGKENCLSINVLLAMCFQEVQCCKRTQYSKVLHQELNGSGGRGTSERCSVSYWLH